MSSKGISPDSHHHNIAVHHPACMIMASKCIFKLAHSPHPSASLHLHNHGFQVHLQNLTSKGSKCICKIKRWLPPNASLNSLDHSLQVHHRTSLIIDSKSISKPARFRSPSLFDYSLPVHLKTCLIPASKLPRLEPPSWLDQGLHRYVQTRSTIPSQDITKLARSQTPSTSCMRDSRCMEIWR